MPRPFTRPSLITAAALAFAAAVPGIAAAQDNGYYAMRNGFDQGFTVPTGRVWSANPRPSRGASATVQGQPRQMSQTMARPSTGFAQSTYPGQLPGQFQQGQTAQHTAPTSRAQGFQPLPPGMGTMPGTTTGLRTATAAAPQIKPSPYGMQMQQPHRADLRVDNRVAQPGG